MAAFSKWWQSWRQTTIANKAVAMASIIVAVATVVYAVVSSFQLSALRKSNRINRDALESVQRAFVNYSPTSEIGTEIAGGRVVAWWPRIPIINSGTTPVRNLTENGTYFTSPSEITEDFAFPDRHNPEHGSLGPRDTMTYEIGPIPITDIQKLYSHQAHIYVYGWATYNDIFNLTKLHKTEFCYELRLNTIAGDVTDPKYLLPGRFNLCPKGLHNCADEECDKK